MHSNGTFVEKNDNEKTTARQLFNAVGMNSENEEYKIMVRKKDIEKARFLVSRNR